jgi:hypothetical protein
MVKIEMGRLWFHMDLTGGRFGGRETIEEEGDVTRPLWLSMRAWKEECETKRYKIDGRCRLYNIGG